MTSVEVPREMESMSMKVLCMVVEAEQVLAGVAVGVVVVPWEIVPGVSIVDQSEGPQGDVEYDHGGAVLVSGGLGMLLAG